MPPITPPAYDLASFAGYGRPGFREQVAPTDYLSALIMNQLRGGVTDPITQAQIGQYLSTALPGRFYGAYGEQAVPTALPQADEAMRRLTAPGYLQSLQQAITPEALLAAMPENLRTAVQGTWGPPVDPYLTKMMAEYRAGGARGEGYGGVPTSTMAKRIRDQEISQRAALETAGKTAWEQAQAGANWLRAFLGTAARGLTGTGKAGATREEQQLSQQHLATLLQEAEGAEGGGVPAKFANFAQKLIAPVMLRPLEGTMTGYQRAVVRPEKPRARGGVLPGAGAL
jgi:hypothetical protein